MTGPEHYKEAEDLLNQPWQDAESAQMFIAQAHVHATLALAAAAVTQRADLDRWYEVTLP